MRSLRLDPDLDDKLQRAAAVTNESVSEFIRHAAEARADEVLDERPRDLFADVAGVVHGGGSRARNSGDAFTKDLAQRRTNR